jgi:RNA polymerase sigma-70 factor, ECF subfamily
MDLRAAIISEPMHGYATPPLDAAERESGPTPAPALDEARLSRIFREHADFVWRHVRRLGLPSAEAEDVTQRAFIVASKKLDRIEVGSERAYLFTTATQLAYNARRARARRREEHVELEIEDASASAEELVDQSRAHAIAERVLEAMDVELRVVFGLFELEEMPIGDISTLLGIPHGTVSSRLRRARVQFRAVAKRIVLPLTGPNGGSR